MGVSVGSAGGTREELCLVQHLEKRLENQAGGLEVSGLHLSKKQYRGFSQGILVVEVTDFSRQL